jgi:hypothetical protein
MPAGFQADKKTVINHVNCRSGLLLRTLAAVFAGMDWRDHPSLGERLPGCFQTSATLNPFGHWP